MEKNDVKNESMAAAQANSVNQAYVNPTPGEITIVGLGTLKTGRKGFSIKSEPYISDKAAQLLAEIGCNASQAQVDIINNGPEFNGFKKSLESCAKAGIKMLPMLGLIESPASKKYYYDVPHRYDDWFTAWGNVAQKYKNYPALGGWFMGDELTAAVMESFARAKSEILKYDTSHVVLANLFAKYASNVKGDPVGEHGQLNGKIEPSPEVSTPSTVPNLVNGFDEYYDYFGNVFGPAIWLSDLYPFGTAYGYVHCNLDAEFYEYLLRMKNLSAKTGRPFWTYVACNFEFIPSPKDENGNDKYNNAELASHIDALTIGRLRFQTFMALAYGAQGICYWNIFGDVKTYRAMPVDVNGFKTSLFDIVKTVNEEIKCYNSVFCGGFPTYLAVIKDPAVDKTDEKLPVITGSYEYLKSISRAPSDKWLYAKYSNGTNTYLILQNMDYLESKVVTVKFKDFPYTYRQVLPGGQLSDYITSYDGEVQPGGVLIFKIGYK